MGLGVKIKGYCVFFLAVVSIFFLIIPLTGCENRPAQNSASDQAQQNRNESAVEETQAIFEDTSQADDRETTQYVSNQDAPIDNVQTNGGQAKEEYKPLAEKPGPHLNEVLHRAYGWNAAMTGFYNRPAPEYSFTDIEGNSHKLSDFKGREVMVVFWATWCGPCRMEVPHLIELRKEKSEDELMIIAVSNEAEKTIENFVKKSGINYSVVKISSQMPAPFSYTQALPTAFFIGEDGRFKIITEGVLPPDQMKQIIESPGWKQM